MKLHRIKALLIRYLYLNKRSLPRLMDIFYWPVLELLLWGFLSFYLNKLNMGNLNMVTVLLGAIILWDLLSQSQRAVAVSFLEEIWEKNLLNLFVTPLRLSEFLVSTVLIGIFRITLVGLVMGSLGLLFYNFNIVNQFGFYLIIFLLNLLFFGWSMGLLIIGVILRFGTSAQIIAFGFMALIQPFSAVFYPVSALPENLRYIAYTMPSTYVFEGMRAVIAGSSFPWSQLGLALLTNAIYLALTCWFFYRMFARVKEKGTIMRLNY